VTDLVHLVARDNSGRTRTAYCGAKTKAALRDSERADGFGAASSTLAHVTCPACRRAAQRCPDCIDNTGVRTDGSTCTTCRWCSCCKGTCRADDMDCDGASWRHAPFAPGASGEPRVHVETPEEAASEERRAERTIERLQPRYEEG
jgi:hypothetical protein